MNSPASCRFDCSLQEGSDASSRLSSSFVGGLVLSVALVAVGLPSGGSALHGVAAALLAGLLATAVVIDVRYRRIPNRLTYTVAGMAVVVNAVATLVFGVEPTQSLPVGAIGLGPSLLGLGTCLGVMIVARALAGVGGGDVKLAAAVGAIVGPGQGLAILLLSHIVAALVVGPWMLWRLVKANWAAGERGGWLHQIYAGELTANSVYVPMAPYFAVSTLLALLGGGA